MMPETARIIHVLFHKIIIVKLISLIFKNRPSAFCCKQADLFTYFSSQLMKKTRSFLTLFRSSAVPRDTFPLKNSSDRSF